MRQPIQVAVVQSRLNHSIIQELQIEGAVSDRKNGEKKFYMTFQELIFIK